MVQAEYEYNALGQQVVRRLWRSLKQEAVYLEEIADGFQARRVISNWMAFYNTERPHSSLEHRTPKETHWRGRDEKLAARKPNPIHLRSAAELFGKPGPLHRLVSLRNVRKG
ncbi:integrase core domain-containing protein [Roseovarius indicus]|uniref:integrase core domain-containing protein n=1 Tax=Roseovarius indicus TaxID=540747 RepID=UPI000942E1FC|nr:integrase core domain-containing protein [Roseovarius indicus]